MRYSFLFFGMVFGFLLSRAGASTYDFYARLFLVGDERWHPQLLIVIGAAVVVGAIGWQIVRRTRRTAVLTDKPLAPKPKPMTRTLIPGALLNGIGWGVAGACPGTALVMLGEGKMAAAVAIAGIIIGVWLHGITRKKFC